MKRFKKFFTVLAMLGVVLLTACGGFQQVTQPIIPKNNIPADADTDVKSEIERLYSSVGRERENGASNLGKMGKRAAPAVPFLIEMLEDKDKNVRKGAVLALGNIKDPRAVEPLIASLKNKDNSVREIAAEALKEITGKDFGQDHAKWQEWWVQSRSGQTLTTLK